MRSRFGICPCVLPYTVAREAPSVCLSVRALSVCRIVERQHSVDRLCPSCMQLPRDLRRREDKHRQRICPNMPNSKQNAKPLGVSLQISHLLFSSFLAEHPTVSPYSPSSAAAIRPYTRTRADGRDARIANHARYRTLVDASRFGPETALIALPHLYFTWPGLAQWAR